MSDKEIVVGIDLGTTNSEVAAFHDGQVRILGKNNRLILPSCVGLSPQGELLVGEPALNQHLLYPERTVRSIKRLMGRNVLSKLGDRDYSPQEISAIILRELADWAAVNLNQPVKKAVITVPAYFSDAQRQATREAGLLAGLDVVRILNEPTAASLAHGTTDGKASTVMVYDLGGGTFDVSIVAMEDEVTEVLSSHGNNQLGGDDFDRLLLDKLAESFLENHGLDLRHDHPAAYSRLWRAAEEAKKTLSQEPFAAILEESLVVRDGKPLHLEMEISREEYEDMILPLVESTLKSVSQALTDAGKKADDLDAVLLVGGSTRTPLVMRILEERIGLPPKADVHPDLCVALGAGVIASRLTGHDIKRVLVDITPYSFGISYLGEKDGYASPHCYRPIIRRNTPLPVTRTESYYTVYPFQTDVEINIYQGDDPDALNNILVGDFLVTGLKPMEEANMVMCRMNLDLNGILNVTAIEKGTGLSKNITIENAMQTKTDKEIAQARKRLEKLFAGRTDFAPVDDDDDEEDWDDSGDPDAEQEADDLSAVEDPDFLEAITEARNLVEKSRNLFSDMHQDDREEAVGINARIGEAIEDRNRDDLADAVEELKELLFFIEGR